MKDHKFSAALDGLVHRQHLPSVLLRAESNHLRGVTLLRKNKYLEAIPVFLSAAAFYHQIGREEKALWCQLHVLIAKSGAGLLTPQEELKDSGDLWLQAEDRKFPHIQALCLRQNSYAYFSGQRFLAALCEIEEALPLIKTTCSSNEYHLALIHAADCALETGDTNRARQWLRLLPDRLDHEVEFPRAYVNAKMHDRTVSLATFPEANPHWVERYHAFTRSKKREVSATVHKVFWNHKTHWLMNDKKQILGKIKPVSPEGSFLKVLMKGPASKESILEALWPAKAVENTEEEFLKLRDRLQQKLGTTIESDGHHYFMNLEIEWWTIKS